tara:strand:+ start:82 stop:261 length:180 start_codon:yes stop_codon:yes gene_type:complete
MKNNDEESVFDYGDAEIAELEGISTNLENLIEEYLVKLFFKDGISSHEEIESLINAYNN